MRKSTDIIKLLSLLLIVGCGNTIQDGSARITVNSDSSGQAALTVQASEAEDPDLVLFRWQGYEQAKTRFRQMDISRRVSQSKLSELFGEKAFKDTGETRFPDLLTWSLGLPQATQASWEKLQAYPRELAILEAFASGVNRYVKEMGSTDPSVLDFYRRLTKDPNYVPDQWKPIDSIAILTQMSYMLSASLEKKMMLGLVYLAIANSDDNRIGISKIEKVLDLRPVEADSIMAPLAPIEPKREGPRGKLFRWLFSLKTPIGDPCIHGSAFGCNGFDIPGSNNWAVSSDFAGGDKTFVANDPHLALTWPNAFTTFALDSKKAGGTYRVRGHVPAGIPGIMIGHNDHIAWGYTNSMSDVDDVYSESFKNGKVRYKKKTWDVPVLKRTFMVRQPDGTLKGIPKKLRVIPWHGPMLSDHLKQFKTVKDSSLGLQFSYKWTGHQGGREMVAILRLNQARDYDMFKDALKHIEVGAQNIVYGDRFGNVAYYSHGRYPMRPYLHEQAQLSSDALMVHPPYIPLNGDGDSEWDGWRENVPEITPNRQYIVTANNDPYGYNRKSYLSDYKDYFGFRFDPGSRAHRIEELLTELKQEDGLDINDMLAIQGDHVDLLACRFVEVFKGARSELKLSAQAERFLKQLIAWREDQNCIASRKSTEMVAYNLALKNLAREYYKWLKTDMDEVFESQSEDFREKALAMFLSSPFAIQTVYHRFREGLQSSEQAQEYQGLLTTALEAATAERAARNLEKVAWGKVHPLRFVNLVKGLLPSLPYPSLPRDGSLTTVDMGGYSALDEFRTSSGPMYLPNVWGPTFRLVMSLEIGKPIEAYTSMPGGSGVKMGDSSTVEALFDWIEGRHKKLIDFAS